MSLIVELQRRRVVRALVGYGIGAFAVLQIVEPIRHGFHWPDAVLSYVVAALAVGFPVVVSLAWIFDVNAGRIERTRPAVGLRGARLAAVLVGIGVLAAAPGTIWYFLVRGPARPAPAPATGDVPRATLDAVPPTSDIRAVPSIAVLPLVNLSHDPDQEYFADGLTEELLNLLAKVPGLHVAGRTSAFAFKGKNEDLRTIAQKLNVAHVLEGSVRKSGDRIRIATQLISATDGYHLWSETYDRKLTDVFAVQDEIAAAVVSALKLKLLQAPSSTDRRTVSVEAHDLYLRGLYFWNLRTRDSLLRAAEFFREAIKADPSYALAYVGLADAIEIRTAYVWVRSDELRAQAKAAALRALELDPDLGEAHASLGIMLVDEFDWSRAIEHFRKAIALRPDYATARQWYATALVNLGRANEARQEIAHALRLDPTSRIINMNAGWIAMLSRDYARSELIYKAALDLASDFEPTRRELAILYALEGKRAEALAEIEKISPDGANRFGRAIVYARTGRRPEAERLARELEESSNKEYVPAAILAPVWAALGDKDKAFAALRRVCKDREGSWGPPVKLDPMYDGLRSDPRFGEILDCLHLR